MTKRYAKRLRDIEPFRVMAILDRAKQLQAQGRDIIHLEVGEPDFVTAEPIIKAGESALARGETHYSQAAGLPSLRQAIADYYRQDYQLDIDPARIMITPGASGALLLISALLLDPGQGLLMSDPGYPCNRHFLRLVEGEGHAVPVGPEDRYQLTAAKAAQHWRDNSVGAIVASPANPTGEILGREQLQALYDVCEQRDGHLVVDEIYQGLSYGQQAPSILEITDQAFVINSFSKYFGMTGWRLGWLVAPEDAIPELEKLAQNLFIASPTIAQHAALAAFDPLTRRILNNRRDEFAERRDFLVPELRRLGFDIPHTPDGAFYVYAGIQHLASDSETFCRQLLEEHGIAITPGCDFGAHKAQQHVRFSYTTGMERLHTAIERLQTVLG